jgi:hypothetical protein
MGLVCSRAACDAGIQGGSAGEGRLGKCDHWGGGVLSWNSSCGKWETDNLLCLLLALCKPPPLGLLLLRGPVLGCVTVRQ